MKETLLVPLFGYILTTEKFNFEWNLMFSKLIWATLAMKKTVSPNLIFVHF